MRGTTAVVVVFLFGCGSRDSDLRVTPVTSAHQAASAAPSFGDPLPGLPTDLLERFDTGREQFATPEDDEGLGPVFNDRSCGACHAAPALGGSSTIIETRFGLSNPSGFDPLINLGGSLIQRNGITDVNAACPVSSVAGEGVPAAANVFAGRRTTPLFGLGLVDAVPDQTFEALEAQQATDPDGVRGKAAKVVELTTSQVRVGKFGWKSQVPTLFQFSGDAYLNEMGITSPSFALDLCPQGDCTQSVCDGVTDPEDDGSDVQAFADFMQLLAPPPSSKPTGLASAGEVSFDHIGCATCHVAELTTGPSSISALDEVTFHAYSDFLLHDMGSLGDGIAQGAAGKHQMRTAPLWGVGRQPFFLHDGRAPSLEQAILLHDGEAKPARDRFAAMNQQNSRKILAFLNTL